MRVYLPLLHSKCLELLCFFFFDIEITLNSRIFVGHNPFLDPTLICIRRVNVDHVDFQPTLKLMSEMRVDHINFF
jgi:hypothetical protein